MATVIPPGYAQFSVEHWLANYTRPAVTTWGARILGTPPRDADGLADVFQELYTVAFAPQIDSNVTIRSTRCVIGQDGPDPLVGVSGLSASGGANRDSTAPALALMVARNTGVGGRANRGRVYFPWALSDTNVSEQGAVATAALTAWQARINVFLLSIEEDEYVGELVVLHSDPLRLPTPITTMVPNPVVRTQKQRQARF
jgi:hypothetical protein